MKKIYGLFFTMLMFVGLGVVALLGATLMYTETKNVSATLISKHIERYCPHRQEPERCGTFYFYVYDYKGEKFIIYEPNPDKFFDDSIQPGSNTRINISLNDFYKVN